MIEKIKIINFYTFKNQVEISFEPSNDTEYRSQYCIPVKPGKELLKLGLVYGANASGKTNLLKTLDFLRNFLLHTKESKTDSTGFVPFMGSAKNNKQPGEIEFTFYLDQIKYIYFLSINQQIVLEESLHYYPGTQPAVIFQRKYAETDKRTKVKFGNNLQFSTKTKSLIEGLTLNNSSVIASMSKANIPENAVDKIYQWFEKKFHATIYPETELFTKSSSQIISDGTFRDFALSVMQKADLDIHAIEVIEKEVNLTPGKDVINTEGGLTVEEYAAIYQTQSVRKKEVVFSHQIDGHIQPLPLDLESKGTLRLFGLSVPLKKALQPGSFLMIDELENSLHNDLVVHFLRMFLMNSKDSQMLATTHNTNILNEDLLRRDTIWFTEKNQQGFTDLYSLLDFRLHKNINPFNAYRTGKLGAKPLTGDPLLKP